MDHQTPSQTLKPKWFSRGLVLSQFTVIGAIVLTGSLVPEPWALRGILLLGGSLGIWALQTMGIHNLHVFPEIPEDGKFVDRGPYRWIRHPMYTSVLLVTFAWMMTNLNPYRVLLWVFFLSSYGSSFGTRKHSLPNNFLPMPPIKKRRNGLFLFSYRESRDKKIFKCLDGMRKPGRLG